MLILSLGVLVDMNRFFEMYEYFAMQELNSFEGRLLNNVFFYFPAEVKSQLKVTLK